MIDTKRLAESLEKSYLNESYVEEWWGQTDEDPFDFANEYNLTCEPLKYNRDEVLYRFTGTNKDIERAKANGYFYSSDYAKDECYSKKPMTEDYEDANGTAVYDAVFEWVQNKIDDFTSQIPVQDLAIEVEGYNPDWCAQDMSDSSLRELEKALYNFTRALTDTYFEYYEEDSEEDYDEY